MQRNRLDKELVARGLAETRSQAENCVRLGQVLVNGTPASKPGVMVGVRDRLKITAKERYVSRAGLKLASVARELGADFRDKIVLDVGSSTGGFTDYALQHGARKVYAVDVGTEQLHHSLRDDARIELHEKTDIRDFVPGEAPDVVLIDVSFISLREILPHIASIAAQHTKIFAMVKPQFEAGRMHTHRGVVKNEKVRREILRGFEDFTRDYFVLANKRDSDVAGSKGNRERFYLLQKVQ